jgi:hypothetical protein
MRVGIRNRSADSDLDALLAAWTELDEQRSSATRPNVVISP